MNKTLPGVEEEAAGRHEFPAGRRELVLDADMLMPGEDAAEQGFLFQVSDETACHRIFFLRPVSAVNFRQLTALQRSLVPPKPGGLPPRAATAIRP